MLGAYLQAHEEFLPLDGSVAVGIVGLEQRLEFVGKVVARFHVRYQGADGQVYGAEGESGGRGGGGRRG